MISAKDARKRLIGKDEKKLGVRIRVSQRLYKKFKIACNKEGLTSPSDVLEDLIKQLNKSFVAKTKLKLELLGFVDRSSSSFYIMRKDWEFFSESCKKGGFRIGHLVELIMVEYVTQVEAEYKIKIQE